ncbi:PQQ-dependent sugar dehydrogenase [Imperialibacter roseus]|uniref:PQQ-dependent sugar dehydrogenase n=1 Tax=Imperialibacter roseus TaxID=1324217 RepID=A0ABZ0IXE2_9BACT|nr:PQQ-dependent sugar dehydrogenase [Imperialibacter roseus]WOK09664.1 PQQ-dependent sugar dehydrogenase [Imperialibacter roseus]|tara:strand:- start:1171 stop:2346 length:1176 start_codon:yes stop_codon:yes gene_type:complete
MILKPIRLAFYLSVGVLSVAISSCGESNKEAATTEEVAEDVMTNDGDSLSKINLPAGFEISIYASGIDHARSMTISPSGTIYVGNRGGDKIYAIQDTDKDGKADKTIVVASGLKTPNGVAFKDGDLYVGEISRLLKYPNVEANLEAVGEPVVVYDDYPTDEHHGWKYIAFGPDGKLYVPVGAPCNICESENEIYATITRMNPDGTGREIFARGVRNTVGMTWDAEGNMWFTDNGRDMLGDDMPDCELNKATEAGMHFGYPYCHAGDISDPEFGSKFPCSDFVAPAQKLGAHVAPLGLRFYNGDMFPAEYKGSIFIAQHGSWNRSKKSGYRIGLVKVENGKAVNYSTFADGWLDEAEQEAWGRPVDVQVMPDGSLLISDDKAGVIYRVTYKA